MHGIIAHVSKNGLTTNSSRSCSSMSNLVIGFGFVSNSKYIASSSLPFCWRLKNIADTGD